MTFDTVKEKLHDYIEHADQNKLIAIYTLLSNEIEAPLVYDEATLNMLETTRDNMLSGKEKTYTLEQTIANIREHRSKHGI
jgi:DNA-binding protein Fis